MRILAIALVMAAGPAAAVTQVAASGLPLAAQIQAAPVASTTPTNAVPVSTVGVAAVTESIPDALAAKLSHLQWPALGGLVLVGLAIIGLLARRRSSSDSVSA